MPRIDDELQPIGQSTATPDSTAAVDHRTDCIVCSNNRVLEHFFCANCGKQLREVLVPKERQTAEPKAEKLREIVVELKLEGKDAFVQEVNEVKRVLLETHKELTALDQALEDANRKLTDFEIATATPYQIMVQQLRQLRQVSAAHWHADNVVAISQAMIAVFKALDDYERPDMLDDEDEDDDAS